MARQISIYIWLYDIVLSGYRIFKIELFIIIFYYMYQNIEILYITASQ